MALCIVTRFGGEIEDMTVDEDIIRAFSAFPLHSFREEWVKNIWEADFTNLDDILEDAQAIVQEKKYFVKHLEACCRSLENFSEGSLWNLLVENEISLKTIVVLLVCLLEGGSKFSSSVGMKESSVLSASLYTRLLAIPGSGAFKLFHPEIVVKCVEQLKLFGKLDVSKRKAATLLQASNKKGGRNNKRSRLNEESSVNDQEECSFPSCDEEDNNDEDEMTPSQCNRILYLLTHLVEDLTKFFEVFSFKRSESTAHRLVPHIVQLTTFQPNKCKVNFNSWPPIEDMSVACLAYRCLNLISCTPSLNIVIFNSVCKCFMPNLLLVGKTVLKTDTQVVDKTVEFLRFMMKTYGTQTSVAISTLIQHMSTKVADKSDFRTVVAQAVISLLEEFPLQTYAKLLEWLFLLSQHYKVSHRTFALEVITLLLGKKEPISFCSGDVSDDSVMFTKHLSLMRVILARCSDHSPSVRVKAIAGFSQCFASLNVDVVSAIRNIVTPQPDTLHPKPQGIKINALNLYSSSESKTSLKTDGQEQTNQETYAQTISLSSASERVATEHIGLSGHSSSFQQRNLSVPFTPFSGIHLTPGFTSADLKDNEGVISMLRRRAGDDNAQVRKTVVKALQNVLLFEKPNFKKENLNILMERCCDPALSVRKQSIQSLTEILHSVPTNEDVQRAWMKGTLPLVMDRENSLQEKCSELVEEVFFGNLTSHERSKDEGHQLLWSLLMTLSDNENTDLRRYLQLACQILARARKIGSNHVKCLISHLETEHNKGAWLLLQIITQFVTKFNPDFVVDYWNKNSQMLSEKEEDTFERVLSVISHIGDSLKQNIRLNMIGDLKSRLKKFESPPGIIAVIVKTLSKLCESQAEAEGKDSISQRETWGIDLLTECDKYLKHVVFEEKLEGDLNEDRIICYLVTIGEVVQLCPANTPQRIYLLVQSIIAGKDIPQDQNSQMSNSQTSEVDGHHPVSQPFSQFRGFTSSKRVRAFAFNTLGKLLLQNEKLAKKCIPALARELETCKDVVLRNNVIVIMCDLCIRYTTIIENYVPSIAVCLKDSSPLIRKQTLTLLTRLLQEDFIKWKGVLFYRFITTLLDENTDIKDFAAFCLTNVLLHRQPTMFFNHFIECIFHFNGYTGSSVYNKFTQSEREKKLFSLQGDKVASKRLRLYLFMLEHTSDQHKFQLTSRLCQDILGGVVDSILPLNQDSLPLLKDSLAILCSKEIKISSIKNKENGEREEQDLETVVVATAKKQLITQVIKKNVIEDIIPIVTSLKYILEKEKSAALKDLMMYLRVLMKDYKTEITEILTGDRQLLKEIEFDLRKFEENQTPMATPALLNSSKPQVGISEQVKPFTICKNLFGVGNQIQGTPKLNKGNRPLLSAAILNSARKNIQRLEELKEARNSPAAKDKRKSVVAWADENHKDTIEESTNCNVKTPTTTRSMQAERRAISTPSGVLGNITFAIDQNVTLIPPSPIPLGTDDIESNKSEIDEDVIFFSPNKQVPKPKKWNIKTMKT